MTLETVEDRLRIACEHEASDRMPELSLLSDEHRVAIMRALAKMQRGFHLFKQAGEKLEIILDNTPSGMGESMSMRPPPYTGFGTEASGDVSFGTSGTADHKSIHRPACTWQGIDETVEDRSNNLDDKSEIHINLDVASENRSPCPPEGKEGEDNEEIEREQKEGRHSKKSFGTFVAKQPSVGSLDQGSEKEESIRACIRRALESFFVQLVSVSLILFTVFLICMDTDARAKGSTVDKWVDIAMFVCFAAYVLEFVMTIYVQRAAAIWSHWNCMDVLVITASSIEYLITLAGGQFAVLRLLRICRLLRLGRVIRALRRLRSVKSFKEQYLLLMMMASGVRTVCWAFLFCFFIMTLWAILAVEFLDDIVVRLDTTTSVWSDCDRCGRSFHSIWESILTFMQTIVAGDSWGLVALPVIEDSWWALLIFTGALSTVIFVVLNMISVVVIDTFAERRSKDLKHVATELEDEEVQERKLLGKMFQQIDADNSGALSVEELQEGAVKVKEFRQYLRVLDIDDKDLVDLFAMIDCDGSGEVDPDEFIDALYRMKATESKTATRFIRYMVGMLVDKTQGLDERLFSIQSNVTSKLNDVEKQIKSEFAEKTHYEPLQCILEDRVDDINVIVANAIDKAMSAVFETVASSAASKASFAVQALVSSSSNQVAAMNARLGVSSRRDAPSVSMASQFRFRHI